MTDYERQTLSLERSVSESVAKALDPIVDDIHSIRRALTGAPEEGNTGIIARLIRLERRQAVLIFLLPVWVTGGTALGQYLVRLWGL